ncbi:MAG TPA: SRPBCC family protein [Actinomycetota bacterium]|nr:SRPBCC family protein [Actinomycetota bacterium]
MADTGSESIEINASAEKILAVVADIEAYPEWMPAFHDARVLETDASGRPSRAQFEVDAKIKVVDYVLEYEYPDGGVSWKSVEGNVKEIAGSYALEESDGSTKVRYTYSIDAGFPIPGFLRKQGVKVMVSSALNDLKRRAESL